MTQFARPDATITAGGWSASSTTLFGDTSDQSDATWARTTSITTLELALGDVTDPASSADHVVRIRARASGSGGPERMNAYLVQGTTIIAQLLSNERINRGSAFTEYSYTLIAFEADSITDYTDLRVRIIPNMATSGEQMDVAEIVMEVPDNASTLTVADLSSGPTVDAVTLAQTHILTVADWAVTVTADGVVLDQQGAALTVADVSAVVDVTPRILADTDGELLTDTESEQLTDDPLDLSQSAPTGGTLAGISDWSVTTTLDNVDLTQTHNITVADATAAATIDGDLDVVVVFELSQFDGGGWDVAATIDSPTLLQTHILIVQDVSVTTTADAVGLGDTLQDVGDLQAAVQVDNANPVEVISLTVADMTTIGRIRNLDVATLYQLSIDDMSATATIEGDILLEQLFTGIVGLTLYARGQTLTLDTRNRTLTIDTRTGG